MRSRLLHPSGLGKFPPLPDVSLFAHLPHTPDRLFDDLLSVVKEESVDDIFSTA